MKIYRGGLATLLYVANKKRCKISTEEEDLELGH
jgi:hypothetical protein